MAKKALIVGINDYAPSGAGGPDLRGCVADARDIAGTLNSMGIVPAVPAQMRILTDSRATRANIITGLKWLLTGAKKGDTLVFHYSGHGSQLPDPSSEEAVDHRDETICPHDYAAAGMIRDDDLRVLFANVPAGVNLDVLLDSCHSGTATREIVDFAVRYVPPPLDDGFFLEANPQARLRRLMRPEIEGAGMRQAVVSPLNHVLWAGCRDNQLSGEGNVGGQVRGFFTYAFCSSLRQAGLSVTRRRLDALVSVRVSQLNASQTPQLEATLPSMAERVFT